MDDSATRALRFAVALFVTLIIVSLVVAIFGKVKEIYSLTKNTDNSIHKGFDNIYETYDGKKLNGMELLNTVKRFEYDKEIVSEVRYPQYPNVRTAASSSGKREVTVLKEYLEARKLVNSHRFTYEGMYTVEVKEISGKTIINFKN